MNLLDLKKASAVVQPNHSVLMYGPPKSGKTVLAGTAAAIPEIEKIYWLDLENGVEALLHSGLTDEQLAKIVLIKITDTRDDPYAIETILRTFTSKTPLNLCEAHGRLDCAECKKAGNPFFQWHLKQATHNDLVVIDSGSQLGDSALAAACLGKGELYKPQFDDYGKVNKWLGDVFSVVQQCRNTNFVVLTHELAMEDDEGKDKIFPLIGSKQFSMKCSKYFGTVAYIHKKGGKHVAGSSSLYRADLMSGSRIGVALEKSKTPNMREILVEGGILGQRSEATEEAKADAEATVREKPLSLAERLALKKR